MFASRNTYRRHSARFKLQVCLDIRSGARSRSNTIKEFKLSNASIQQWMTKFDSGELDGTEDEATHISHYEILIAALERQVGRLTMELELSRQVIRAHSPQACFPPTSPDDRD